jgi:hypothetical protein
MKNNQRTFEDNEGEKNKNKKQAQNKKQQYQDYIRSFIPLQSEH